MELEDELALNARMEFPIAVGLDDDQLAAIVASSIEACVTAQLQFNMFLTTISSEEE